ncbi:MAG: wax ester/triacylglycerol synthase family O-acyltransferase, partial [Caldilineaceae bacterium]|nr:wax ester/triacylglycerol synthase family O-acyltransferase [Caldilineaceae bacterium]
PYFVEDPDFDIHSHIRRIGLPAPGGPEQLGNLIGDLVSLKLDRRKPLWEFWIIDGLADGHVAILAKIHHAIIDGISGSELATVLMDLEADPPPTPPEADRVVDAMPNQFELFARGALEAFGTPYRAMRFGRGAIRQGLKFVGFQRRAAPPVAPFQAPRTSFNTELSKHRRFAYASVPLADVRAVKDAFDVKVNDVVLAICSGALRNYLDANGELPDAPLVAQVPVSLRAEEDKADVGTKVGAMFASLATHLHDPVERLHAIHASTRDAKEMQQALAAEKIMGITEAAPPALISLAARMYTAAGLDSRTPPIMNLIISNVPGPQEPRYFKGALLEATYPVSGIAPMTTLNVTVYSYNGTLFVGLIADRRALRHLEDLKACMEEVYAEFRRALLPGER